MTSSSPIAARYTYADFVQGARDGIPIALSIIPWGLAFGIAAQPLVTMAQALVMSGYVFSGTAQFVALGMWHSPFAIASLLLAIFAVNARYLLQGLTLAPWMSSLPWWQRWGTLFFLSDGCSAISLKHLESRSNGVGHLLGSSVLVYGAWLLSSWIGLLIPIQHLDAKSWGLDFAIGAALIAFAGARWSGRRSVLPWLVAASSALISAQLLSGSWYMLIGGIAGAMTGAWNDGRKNS
jgi:predicted branched-subunit amino acid permease